MVVLVVLDVFVVFVIFVLVIFFLLAVFLVVLIFDGVIKCSDMGEEAAIKRRVASLELGRGNSFERCAGGSYVDRC